MFLTWLPKIIKKIQHASLFSYLNFMFIYEKKEWKNGKNLKIQGQICVFLCTSSIFKHHMYYKVNLNHLPFK